MKRGAVITGGETDHAPGPGEDLERVGPLVRVPLEIRHFTMAAGGQPSFEMISGFRCGGSGETTIVETQFQCALANIRLHPRHRILTADGRRWTQMQKRGGAKKVWRRRQGACHRLDLSPEEPHLRLSASIGGFQIYPGTDPPPARRNWWITCWATSRAERRSVPTKASARR